MAQLTHHGFELIARVLRDAMADGVSSLEGVLIAERFADELAKDNPRFKRERFLRACGIDSDRTTESVRAAEQPHAFVKGKPSRTSLGPLCQACGRGPIGHKVSA